MGEQEIRAFLDLPLEEIIRTKEDYDQLVGIATDWGWEVTERTLEWVRVQHPDDPEKYDKYFPISLHH